MQPRSVLRILFLQGPPSRFCKLLADEAERQGHTALRINLCVGDWLTWVGRPAVNYKGALAGWRDYLEDFLVRERVTDIVYYADRLPYHRVALEVAEKLGLRATTYEFGYLRPDWITLERGGMSSRSHFPTDPDRIKRIAALVAEPDLEERYLYPFHREAFHEVVFNLSNYFLKPLFWRYQADKYYNPLVDYLSYIPRLIGARILRTRTRALISRLIDSGTPYFVVPLQMQSDYQLRANSPYGHQRELIEEVIASFARHAAPANHLLFKMHPLDNGLERWSRTVSGLASRHGIAARVHLVDGGKLKKILRPAKGVVLVNSTVGLHALFDLIPIKVLGMAVFDIVGLTHQGPLDTFWTAPEQPEPALRDAFVRAIAGTIQVKGNFYTSAGRAAAIAEIVRRLAEGRVNMPDAFVTPPPRLALARARGVPFTAETGIASPAPEQAPAS